jgi:hypothetical protein
MDLGNSLFTLIFGMFCAPPISVLHFWDWTSLQHMSESGTSNSTESAAPLNLEPAAPLNLELATPLNCSYLINIEHWYLIMTQNKLHT